jgi:hypothetical protein
MPKPLCFVLMPFGKKPDSAGNLIDFDAVYEKLIAPAIRDAGMEPLRADEEISGGIIHKPMFERLGVCDFAVADLTTANANVFYELGVRHAVRPHSTVLVFAEGGRLPFDVAPVRALPYRLSPAGEPVDVDGCRAALSIRLKASKNPDPDSPIYQLIANYHDIAHRKTDVFASLVDYPVEIKRELSDARASKDRESIRAIERGLGDLDSVEYGVAVDLLLSYREVNAYAEMISLVERMSPPLAASVLVQEQYGFALNRAGFSDKAERVLLDVTKGHGPSSETYGILGRVYKDRWQAAVKAGDCVLAPSTLQKAIDTYLKGFEADWRDAYPGVNVVTLMEVRDPPDPRRSRLTPVVAYAAERRVAGGGADYWDHATLLEVAVLEKDQKRAVTALGDALACKPKDWHVNTTADNLAMIRAARKRRGESEPWALDIEKRLRAEAKK